MAAAFEVEIQRDVVFATADEGGRELKLNTYRAAGAVTAKCLPVGRASAPALSCNTVGENVKLEDAAVKNKLMPCCILVHGGGFAVGDKEQLEPYALALARAGITCVAPEYRLILRDGATWPMPIHDVKAAIRWTRANASALKIDPDRIAIGGNSAGGHLSLFAAGTPNVAKFEGTGGNAGVSTAVQAVYAIYGITDRTLEQGAGRRMEEFLGKLGAAVGDEDTADFSPIVHVSADFPPTQLIHGEGDTTVIPEHSFAMRDALRKVGAIVELQTYAGQPHAFDLDGHVKADYLGKNPQAYLELIASSLKLFFGAHL